MKRPRADNGGADALYGPQTKAPPPPRSDSRRFIYFPASRCTVYSHVQRPETITKYRRLLGCNWGFLRRRQLGYDAVLESGSAFYVTSQFEISLLLLLTLRYLWRYTTLCIIVSLILLTMGHVFRFRIVSRMCEFGRRSFTEVNNN